MKIAISSTGKTLDDEIDARFGRCPYFVIIDIDEKEKKIKNVKAIENTAAGQFGGAGITASQLVANEKVNAVITTNLGPRAFQVLNQLRIEIYQGQGKVRDVVQEFMEGKLEKIEEATGPMFMGKQWKPENNKLKENARKLLV